MLEAGVTFFDTADVYGGGHFEELLGRGDADAHRCVRRRHQDRWVDFDGRANRSRYDDVDAIVAGMQESLRRLGTDHVEVIHCHVDFPEPNTPVFVEGFRRLKEAGTVRARGVSTSDPDHLRRFNADGDCDVLQTDYSIVNPNQSEQPSTRRHPTGRDSTTDSSDSATRPVWLQR